MDPMTTPINDVNSSEHKTKRDDLLTVLGTPTQAERFVCRIVASGTKRCFAYSPRFPQRAAGTAKTAKLIVKTDPSAKLAEMES